MKRLLAAVLALGLAACASTPKAPTDTAATVTGPAPSAAGQSTARISPYPPAQEDPATRGDYTAGGLYKPGVADSTPDYVPDVARIPEPEVVAEPRSRVGNRATYSVLGKQYHVLDDASAYAEQGLASYYGKKFHGRRTSNLEVYDMNAFTAAHKTLPLPSFARVTNLDNGKSVVVRVNDRGPFHAGRIVDLSYAAAVKLGITQRGTGRVEVRALTPGRALAPPVSTASTASSVGERVAAAPASTLDALVASLPVGSAGALALPAGVRIATGQPTRLNVAPPAAALPAVGSSAVASAVALPAIASPAAPPALASAGAPSAAVAAQPSMAAPARTAAGADATPAADWRFDMLQDGTAMSADQFDAWMSTRQVRVATGRPGLPPRAGAAVPPATSVTSAAPGVVAAAGSPARNAAEPAAASADTALASTAADHRPASAGLDVAPEPVAARDTDSITLQIASFAARGNADRALGMLQGAGIAAARLLDAQANGQQVWRLRVGPLAAAEATLLAARIVGLGFGAPQRVRD